MTLLALYLVLFIGLLSVRKSINERTPAKQEVCFQQTGCLSLGAPWVTKLRPFPAPDSPEKINMELYLETRSTMKESILNLKVDTSSPERAMFLLNDGDYRSDRERTVFIIHGFASQVQRTWVRDMADAYLSKVDANVFLVDWEGGASQANYLQVASNTRVVGILLANFIQFLIDETSLKASQIHIIGHSLGAHIASYVGKKISNIHRITGLDVAQPGFEGYPSEIRLTAKDAKNVDAHHTNGKPTFPLLGFGFITPIGHVDFYYNGGADQPACLPELISLKAYNITSVYDVMLLPVEFIDKWLSCSHVKAIQYFTEALRRTDCTMWGFKEFLTFGRNQSEKISACTISRCTAVGLDTFASLILGKLYVSTKISAPYCTIIESAIFQSLTSVQVYKAKLQKLSLRNFTKNVKCIDASGNRKNTYTHNGITQTLTPDHTYSEFMMGKFLVPALNSINNQRDSSTTRFNILI